MGLFLLLTLPLLAIATQPVSWYLARGLSQATTDELTKIGCFRGTYGRFELSIFTCEGYKGEKFAEIPPDAPICVVEFADYDNAFNLINERADARILWTGDSEIILTSRAEDYPMLSCGSRSDYAGAALNVIRVPRSPLVPRTPLEPLKNLADQRILNLLNQFSSSSIQESVEKLASYWSRNSLATTAVDAVDWTASQLESYGFRVTQQSFRNGMCNNIIAERAGTVRPNDIVMVGAHLDSRAGGSNDNTSRAPGADDNASGTASVIELAKVLAANPEFTTEHTIQLMTFCGEEQGLLGSAFMAANLPQPKRYVGYYNLDMIGYNCRGKGNQTNPLAFMAGNSSPELNLECKEIVLANYPAQPIGDTTACCSDQQSFHRNGVQSIGIFECTGTGVLYPAYHTSNDVPANVDYDQVNRFAKGLLSCFLHRAIPSGPM